VRLLLFDVDGTLLLARGAGRRALARALEEVFGTAGDLDAYDLRGKTDLQVVHDVMMAAGVPSAAVARGMARCFWTYARRLREEIGDGRGVQVLPGVPELLGRLRDAGALLALLTGNTEEGARIKLHPTGLLPLFRTGAYGSDDPDRRRLAALAAGRAQALAGRAFAPRDVVVVGDTPHDIDCARAFGAVAVAVATGQVSRDELAAASPDLLFDDFSDFDRIASDLLAS
jgi:phosphoglycolate phosphatase-like HAD superfamily hydrolase